MCEHQTPTKGDKRTLSRYIVSAKWQTILQHLNLGGIRTVVNTILFSKPRATEGLPLNSFVFSTCANISTIAHGSFFFFHKYPRQNYSQKKKRAFVIACRIRYENNNNLCVQTLMYITRVASLFRFECVRDSRYFQQPSLSTLEPTTVNVTIFIGSRTCLKTRRTNYNNLRVPSVVHFDNCRQIDIVNKDANKF